MSYISFVCMPLDILHMLLFYVHFIALFFLIIHAVVIVTP